MSNTDTRLTWRTAYAQSVLAFGYSDGRLSKAVGQGCWPQIDRLKAADDFPLISLVVNKHGLKAVTARNAEKLGFLGLIRILFGRLP